MDIQSKFTLASQSDFLRFIDAISPSASSNTVLRLESHFFDTEDHVLDKLGAALRIRSTTPGDSQVSTLLEASITFKRELQPCSSGEVARQKVEVAIEPNLLRSSQNFQQLLWGHAPEICTALQECLNIERLPHLVPSGSYITNRHIFVWNYSYTQPGAVIHADESFTDANSEHAFEIESAQSGMQSSITEELIGIFHRKGIDFKPSTTDKHQLHCGFVTPDATASISCSQTPQKATMSVQAKLVLPTVSDYETFRQILSISFKQRLEQNTLFLDGPEHEITNGGAALRVRWSSDNPDVIATLKEQSGVADGNALAWSQHHSMGRCTEVPTDVSGLPPPLQATLQQAYGVFGPLQMTGSYDTTRDLYDWMPPGSPTPFTLNLDHVRYPSGRELFEVEVHNVEVPVSDLVEDLCLFLRQHKVNFTLSAASKQQYIEC